MAKNKMVKNKNIYYQLIIGIELLILAVCSVVILTTKKPEAFTELYFENHINLPKEINFFEQYKFTFTIHNLENKDMDYPYLVYSQVDDEKTIISRDRVYVKNNEFKSIEKTIGPLVNLRSKIVVELVNKNQNISFWMEKQNVVN